jgi:hypothetical protein
LIEFESYMYMYVYTYVYIRIYIQTCIYIASFHYMLSGTRVSHFYCSYILEENLLLLLFVCTGSLHICVYMDKHYILYVYMELYVYGLMDTCMYRKHVSINMLNFFMCMGYFCLAPGRCSTTDLSSQSFHVRWVKCCLNFAYAYIYIYI